VEINLSPTGVFPKPKERGNAPIGLIPHFWVRDDRQPIRILWGEKK
jgi:hypothetical protein